MKTREEFISSKWNWTPLAFIQVSHDEPDPTKDFQMNTEVNMQKLYIVTGQTLVFPLVKLKGYPPTERGVKQCQGNVGQQGQVRIFGLRKKGEWKGERERKSKSE